MSFNKIFGIGESRTGTTSLQVCLQTLGFGPIFNWSSAVNLILLNKCVFDENIYREQVVDMAKKTNGFKDLFWNYKDYYKSLDKAFVGSKFILTERSADKWFDSIKRFNIPKKINRMFNHPDWISKMARNPNFMSPFVFKEVIFLISKQRWNLKGDSLDALRVSEIDLEKDNMIKAYLDRNNEIKNYFRNRPRDFLVIDWEQGAGWPEICNFLERPVLESSIPHAHKRKR